MLSTGLLTATVALLVLSAFLALAALALAREARRNWVSAQMIEAKLTNRITEVRAEIDKTTSAKLRAELQDLSAAVEIDRLALRRQLGKIWKRIGRDAEEGGVEAVPDELAAIIELQRAHGGS